MEESVMNMKTKELTLTALMAAVICVLGPIAVPLPFSPVPISLTMVGEIGRAHV